MENPLELSNKMNKMHNYAEMRNHWQIKKKKQEQDAKLMFMITV